MEVKGSWIRGRRKVEVEGRWKGGGKEVEVSWKEGRYKVEERWK